MTEAMSQSTVTGQGAASSQSSENADGLLQRLIAAVEYAPMVAIQSIDRDGFVRLWNITSSQLYGIKAQDAVGKRLSDLLMHKGKEVEFAAVVQSIWDSGQAMLPQEWHVTTASNKEIWVYSTLFPVLRGKLTQQIFCMDVDVTERKKTEQALLVVGANFRALFDRSAEAILLVQDDQLIEVNPAALQLFGKPDKSEMLGKGISELSPLTQADGTPSPEAMKNMIGMAQKNGNHRFEWRCLRQGGQDVHGGQDGQGGPARAGTEFPAEILLTSIPLNGDARLYAVVRDMTERNAIAQSLLLAAQVFEISREAIMIADPGGRIVSVNPAFTDITGYPPDQVIGKPPEIIGAAIDGQASYVEIWNHVNLDGHWQGEALGQRRDGRAYPQWLSMTAVRDPKHKVRNYIGIFSDITERKAAETHTRHMAEHDFLTDLPNRVLLLDRLGQALMAAKRQQTQLAVMFLDLDRFKNINDSLGHPVGDKLLKAVAERLKQCVRGIDTVSRQGGDEFVIMLADIGGVEHAAHIAENVLHAVIQPYQIDDYEINVTTSIGISIYPGDGEDMDVLIKNADLAMYHAKEGGRNCFQFFNSDMNARVLERITLECSLKKALSSQEFVLQYQPEVDIASGRIIGAEALIRWQHPELGVLLPQRFISIAEDSGLIAPIGDWVLRTACRQAKSWLDLGMPIIVAVNISVAQFRQKCLLQSVIDALQESGLDARFLELEITESIMLDGDRGASIDILRTLRKMGVTLAVDDFGTGYSSLGYLKRFPVDKLKIDPSFVRDISFDPDDAAIVGAIIVMAKSLRLKVTAEGVETTDQLEFLKAHGCDQYQGNLLSKPLLSREIPGFVSSFGRSV